MNSPISKAGPLAYVVAVGLTYSLLVNCGDKPTLSRTSSNCTKSGDSNAQKPATGTGTGSKTKKDTSAALVDGEYQDSSDLVGSQSTEESDDSLGLADEAETFFNDIVKTIFDQKCVSCHKSGGSTPPAVDTYAAAKKAAADSLARMKLSAAGVMPTSGRLPDDQVAKVAQWVQLLNSGGGSSGGGSTATAKATSKATSTAASKAAASTNAVGKSDDCKAVPPANGSSTATATSTSKKSGTGTSTKKS